MTATKIPEPHPGMMGDGTEEQNLGQEGNPEARITEDEVRAAFDPVEGRAAAAKLRQEDLLDESLKESFPASDSPRPKKIT
jgi:hypothetical protein